MGAIQGGGSSPEPTTSPTEGAVAPSEQPSEEPTPEPEPEESEPAKLDEIRAAQYLASAWEDKFLYGGTVHWIADRITSENSDGTYVFKIGATVKNEYGTEFEATIEGTVGGTAENPEILDSILYAATGEVVDYYG